MTVAGWALTIAGVPVVFTTHDQGTITSSSPLWWGGEAGVTYANGWLVRPTGTITERARPLEGELDLSALSFDLHDAATTAGGSPLLTSLAGKDSVNTTSTPLASTITAAATAATVGDGGVFSSPCFAWINGEAVRVTSIGGNVLTITRGRLGTKAVAHTVDAGSGRFPEAFTGVPWVTRRKVHLWRVDAGVATLVWAGYAVRAPQLAGDGARYTVACDSLWSVQANNPVGGTLGATRFAGYSDGRSRSNTSAPPLLSTATTLSSGAQVREYSNGPYRDLNQLFSHHQARVSAATLAAGQRIELFFARTGAAAFTVDGDSTAAWSTRLRWTDRPEAVSIVAALRVASRYSASGVVTDVPSSLVMLFTQNPGGLHLVSSLAGLPASWSASVTTEASLTTSEQPALRLQINDDWSCLFTTIVTADASDETGPQFTSRYALVPRRPGDRELPLAFVIPSPGPLRAVYRVRAEHWALGLKHSVVGLCEDAGSLDWDWDSIYDNDTNASGPLLAATAGLRVARDWIFDGKRTLGSVVTECCLLHGCTPVTRSGRMALHAWGWPSAQETPVVTLTTADLIGLSTWQRFPDGIANRLVLKSDALNIDATLQQSRARYGPGRNITVELAGMDDQSLPFDDAIAFAREVVGRLELWSEPLGMATLTVKGSHWGALELGAVFSASEWMLPSGSGGRGLSSALAVVVGRTLDLSSATVKVDALLFPRRSYPYAPCAKASSVVSGTVLALATGYVGGTTSYSGGNDASTFAAGDVVELVERDTTTLWTEQLTIASVDTTLGRVTFTGSMSATAQAKIAAGWVDLRFADYADCQASQQTAWMFVADDATAVIDGTSEPQRLIAP